MTRDSHASTIALRTLPMFEMLNDSQLTPLARAATIRSIARNTEVLHAGDHTDNIYLILSGSLKVLVTDEEGRQVILSILGPGEFFGEMGIIDEHPRSATVVAAESSDLVVISKADFKRCLADNFDVSLYIMRSLVKRLRLADRKIESISLMDVYGRVARLLLDMAEEEDGRKVVKRRVTRQDIAKMIGASREMVSRVMRDLQLQGLIEETGDYIWLRDKIGGS